MHGHTLSSMIAVPKVLANRLKLQAEKIVRSRHQQFAHTHTHVSRARKKKNQSLVHTSSFLAQSSAIFHTSDH